MDHHGNFRIFFRRIAVILRIQNCAGSILDRNTDSRVVFVHLQADKRFFIAEILDGIRVFRCCYQHQHLAEQCVFILFSFW